MKTFIVVLVAVGASVGITTVVVSQKKAGQFATEKATLQQQWDAEKEKLERDLKRARSQSPRIETVETTVEKTVEVDGRMSPEQIIQKMAAVHPTGGDTDRATQLREIIFLMESLKEHGKDGVPAVRSFLAMNQDVDYDPPRQEGEGAQGGDNRGGDGRDRGRGRDGGGFGGPGGTGFGGRGFGGPRGGGDNQQ